LAARIATTRASSSIVPALVSESNTARESLSKSGRLSGQMRRRLGADRGFSSVKTALVQNAQR
jgi:hypothetical protein